MNKDKKGTLYLIPNTLGHPELDLTIPAAIRSVVADIDVYIVENLRNARRYLKMIDRGIDIDKLTFHELNEHTPDEVFPDFFKEMLGGFHAAVISEAGVPGVADPGSAVVRMAHELRIRVVPMTGPSSILLSLMASGLNGQEFRFHGYLPIKRGERIKKIRQIEQDMVQSGETQIFIETPYRNDALLSDILDHCLNETLLCIAADITQNSEYIHTRQVGKWKTKKPVLHKRPAIFLLGK